MTSSDFVNPAVDDRGRLEPVSVPVLRSIKQRKQSDLDRRFFVMSDEAFSSADHDCNDVVSPLVEDVVGKFSSDSVVLSGLGLTSWPAAASRQGVTQVDACRNKISFDEYKEDDPTSKSSSLLPASMSSSLFPATLTVLDLSHNQISRLPSSFWLMSHLRRLDLSHNRLESVDALSFASAVILEHFDLSHNYLQRLPGWFNELRRVRALRLNDNTLSCPTAFDALDRRFGRNCRWLRSLDLSNCAIKEFGNHHLFEARDLRELVLGAPPSPEPSRDEAQGEHFSDTLFRNSLPFLPRQISHSVGLVSLVVSGVGLSDIPEELGLLSNLRALDLSHNDIFWLPTSLAGLSKLQSLRLSGNHLDSLPYKVEELASLQELLVADNEVSWVTEDIGRCRERLRTLDLYGNKLDVEGARPVNELTLLEELDLGKNDLGMDGIEESLGIRNYREMQSRLRSRLRVDREDTEEVWESSREVRHGPRCKYSFQWGIEGMPAIASEEEDDEEEEEEESDGEGGFEVEEEDLAAAEKREEGKKDNAVRASPTQFLWDRLSPDNTEEDEDWTETARQSSSVNNPSSLAPDYDFDDMGKYCSGRFNFVPSDLHPKSVKGERARLQTSRQQQSMYYVDEIRSGRPGRRTNAATRRSSSVSSSTATVKTAEREEGRFDDAD